MKHEARWALGVGGSAQSRPFSHKMKKINAREAFSVYGSIMHWNHCQLASTMQLQPLSPVRGQLKQYSGCSAKIIVEIRLIPDSGTDNSIAVCILYAPFAITSYCVMKEERMPRHSTNLRVHQDSETVLYLT